MNPNAQGRSVSGTVNILRTLSAMFEDAITDECCESNPVRKVVVRANDPRCVKPPKAKRIWTFDQMHDFATAARTAAWTNQTARGKEPTEQRHPELADMAEAMVRVLADSGLRMGEMLPLYRTDLRGMVFHVQRTTHEGETLSGTKTTHGLAVEARKAPCSRYLFELLMRLPARMDGLLFATPTGCLYRASNFYKEIWRPTKEATGMDCTPQEFRASWESHLRAAGIDQADLAAMAGHSIETANRHYVQPLERSYEQVRSVVG